MMLRDRWEQDTGGCNQAGESNDNHKRGKRTNA